jgi:pimeloyl-ACP methyl ester carboxylesterase
MVPSSNSIRRRFVGYLVAVLTLSLAAQVGLGGLSPTMAADLEEPVVTSYAWAPVRTVTAGGTTYTYRELGPKGGIPVVFFVHLAGNLDNWDPRIIDPIAKHRHVIAFDNKGVGASTGTVPPTIEEAADDAYTFVKALGFDLIDVFSFSMGGMIAQDLVLKHPDLVRKLVLTGNDVGKLAAKAFIKRLQERTVDRDKAMSVEGFQTQLNAIVRFGRSAPSDLSAITQPTLIANGDNDRMVPTVLSEDLHRRIRGSELVIYPDSGHGGIFQFHEKFAPLAVEFLGR